VSNPHRSRVPAERMAPPADYKYRPLEEGRPNGEQQELALVMAPTGKNANVFGADATSPAAGT